MTFIRQVTLKFLYTFTYLKELLGHLGLFPLNTHFHSQFRGLRGLIELPSYHYSLEQAFYTWIR